MVTKTRLPLIGVFFAANIFTLHVDAFSLLGPYADWMTANIGYRQPGDIGGPMDIGQGYRWNVPVLTYSFDQSFTNYFGSNGVAAVESAIEILNNLPSASSLDLSNFSLNTMGYNWSARGNFLLDLKSAALYLLLEHMGLASPSRYLYTLRRWPRMSLWGADQYTWPDGTDPYYVLKRNFDPETLTASDWLNGQLYTGIVDAYGTSNTGSAFVEAWRVDPDAQQNPAVVDGVSGYFDPYGTYFTGLSRDDAGGLRYLLASNNVKYETLPPDASRPGGNKRTAVSLVLRAGVEKITFERLEYDSIARRLAKRWRARFIDNYIVSNQVVHQELERVLDQPDFLFSATDTGASNSTTLFFERTGTGTWTNNAAVNGNPAGAGPGTIQPPVRIAFHKLGAIVVTDEAWLDAPSVFEQAWGSFDGTTNAPAVYPPPTQQQRQLTLRLRLLNRSEVDPPQHELLSHTWVTPVGVSGGAALQVSTNLTDWVSLAVVTNRGGVVEWYHYGAYARHRFFRVLPQ